MPARSLKRSSVPPLAGFTGTDGMDAADATATELAGLSEVSDEELPHNSRTACETGWARSPTWNSERNIGSAACEFVVVEAEATVTGATVRTSGNVDR